MVVTLSSTGQASSKPCRKVWTWMIDGFIPLFAGSHAEPGILRKFNQAGSGWEQLPMREGSWWGQQGSLLTRLLGGSGVHSTDRIVSNAFIAKCPTSVVVPPAIFTSFQVIRPGIQLRQRRVAGASPSVSVPQTLILQKMRCLDGLCRMQRPATFRLRCRLPGGGGAARVLQARTLLGTSNASAKEGLPLTSPYKMWYLTPLQTNSL